MSPLDDATLRDLLERRVGSSSLRADERDQILGAVGARRTAARPASALSLGSAGWLGFAAAALSLILVAVVVLKAPIDQGPTVPNPPGSSPTANDQGPPS